jgi:hypothetical protein
MIALPTGILATGFTEKIRSRTEEYKRLVRDKAEDGVITDDEQLELNQRARELGIKTSNIGRLGAEELEDVARNSSADEKLGVSRLIVEQTTLIGPVKPQVVALPPVAPVPLQVMRAEPEDPVAEELPPMRTTPVIRAMEARSNYKTLGFSNEYASIVRASHVAAVPLVCECVCFLFFLVFFPVVLLIPRQQERQLGRRSQTLNKRLGDLYDDCLKT